MMESKKQDKSPGQRFYALSRKFYLAAGLLEAAVGLSEGAFSNRMNSGLAFAMTYCAVAFLVDEIIGLSVDAVPPENVKKQNQLKDIGNGVGVAAGSICAALGLHQGNPFMAFSGAAFALGAGMEFRAEGELLPIVSRRAYEGLRRFLRRKLKTEWHNFKRDPTKPAALLNAAGFAAMVPMLAQLHPAIVGAIFLLGMGGAACEWQADGVQPVPG